MWPAHWELILSGNPYKDVKNGNQPEVKTLWGSCTGSKAGHFFGCLQPMPPQQGVHGFQRFTFMKFYTKLDENKQPVYDPNQVWAYEGCVLPGGKIIIGRWFDHSRAPDDVSRSSGPFIWWNVEESAAVVPIQEKDAFEFLDTVQDPSIGIY